MSFDFNTLITDRSQADVSALSALMAKKLDEWAPEELEQFNNGLLKGGYFWTDLNRVTAAMDYLDKKFKEYGYKTGYEPIIISSGGLDKDVALLLHGDLLEDSSFNSVSVEPNGVTISEDQSRFGGKSLFFDGNSFLRFSDQMFIFGTGDFTVDWWEYKTTDAGTSFSINILSDPGYSNMLLFDGLYLYSANIPSMWNLLSGARIRSVLKNQWAHCALVRNGSNITFYQNGKQTWNTSFSGNLSGGSGICQVGAHGLSPVSDYFSGYIDEFRISKVARWTSDFTPPDKPYSGYDMSWNENLIPTKSTMEQYLSNINKLKAQITLLKTTPSSPVSMQLLDWVGANNIEQILFDIEKQLITMASTFVACGPATYGGDYL